MTRVASFWDSLRAAFGATSASRSRKPAPKGRGRTALKYGTQGRQGTRTRAQLADRADRNPPAGQKVRKTSSRFPGATMGYRAFEGNYPPRSNLRVRETLEGTRSQLAQRRAGRAAQGYPASTPHRLSGEGARSSVRGRGVAPRPASPLPGDRTPVARNRRNPKTTGSTFAFPARMGR